MAAPMRDSPLDGGHRAKVADATRTTTATKPESATSNNFEYDDNEWDIGIGDLIIDLDADIEKTNEIAATTANNHMASTAGGGGSGGGQQTAGGQANKAGSGAAKMAIEHSATVDKGLKMKIKRTKPGTKTSEAKHEIVKSANELNGTASSTTADVVQGGGGDPKTGGGGKHTGSGTAANNAGGNNQQGNSASGGAGANSNSSKRGSSGHRRDKARDKHVSDNKPAGTPSAGSKPVQGSTTGGNVQQSAAGVQPDVNGVVVQRGTVSGGGGPVQPQQPPPRAVFPASTGPGPPPPGSAPGPPQSPAAATAAGSASKPEQTKVAAVVLMPSPAPAPSLADDRTSSPPPAKKMKTSNDPKETADVCIGTSVGTITEPDCLGPCEPGTSVTLEGIVWHETEGGVLVVNVTWRGKTYVGTLLDCTRHDWAPPRFCDSPTSDLDARTPKGRGKRGRAAAASTPGNDLSNFTETRSSVHSKLRNGGAKGRRGGANGNGNGNNAASTGTASPTPFIPPRPEPSNKRKSRVGDDDIPTPAGKKSRIPATVPASPVSTTSPPASPILLECPEPNCSKKYKHINGLKYHQSHAHGSVDDDDTKDVTSMSENDESNIEAPSPATPVKSPEKIGDTPSTPQKKDEPQSNSIPNTPLSSVGLIVPDVSSQPSTPKSRPASPPTPQSSILSQPPPEIIPSVAPPPVDSKSIVKPGVLRFGPGPADDFTFANKPPMSTPVASGTGNLTAIRTVGVTGASNQPGQAESSPLQPTVFQNQSSPLQPNSHSQQIPSHHPMAHQPPLSMPPQHPQSQPNHPQNMQSPQGQNNKIPQFKVKPTAALMPDDKKDRNKPPGYKKKNRKSPAGSPHPQPELPTFGTEQGGREDVQSPAYSDISDDTAPVLESEVSDKNKTPVDKKTEPGPPIPHSMPQYGMYPFYGQPPYLVPSVQQPPQTLDGKTKEGDKGPEKLGDKEGKKEGPEFQQKVLPQHYFSYGYMQGYQYNIESQYGPVSMVPDDKIKEERLKENPSPAEHGNKQATPIPNPIQVPTPAKVKSEPGMKEKHQNENHQILKESIEMKSQMNPFIYSRQQQQQVQQQQQAQQNHHHHAQQQAHHQQQQQQAHQHQQQAHQQQQVHQQQQQQQAHQQQQAQQQREEDIRRYYLYPDQQRRKDNTSNVEQSQKTSGTPKAPPQPNTNVKHKDKPNEEKKEKETKQEGVKPTMETQGPPPPPTSQYYIHPSYMQSPHYGTLPFDPNHPMYRSMIVPGPYGGAPYLHPQIPRYHAPEDLSRGPQPQTKALDILQHHANQYYTSHKIHELQERAMKSPTPKTSAASASPSNAGQVSQPPQGNPQGPPVSQGPGGPGSGPPQGGKQTPGDGKDSRSPPPQRHVHTHHHTHVGLGYPILAGQYPAPYGAAAVLASQQAAAVTVINPYPPK